MKDIIGILKAKYAENEPISIEDIRFALPQLTRGRIYQILDELIDKGELKRFKQGVYYIPTQTILGESLLDPRKVINQKYISDGSNYYGYYTGLSLLNASKAAPNTSALLPLLFTTSVLPCAFFSSTLNVFSLPWRLTVTCTLSPGRYLLICSCNAWLDLIGVPFTAIITSPISIPAALAELFSANSDT